MLGVEPALFAMGGLVPPMDTPTLPVGPPSAAGRGSPFAPAG